jgi:hypothetical protein
MDPVKPVGAAYPPFPESPAPNAPPAPQEMYERKAGAFQPSKPHIPPSPGKPVYDPVPLVLLASSIICFPCCCPCAAVYYFVAEKECVLPASALIHVHTCTLLATPDVTLLMVGATC